MMWGYSWQKFMPGFFVWPWILAFALFDLVLRGYALWYSARRGQNVWFIVLLVVNSLGILPLIYLLLNKKGKK